MVQDDIVHDRWHSSLCNQAPSAAAAGRSVAVSPARPPASWNASTAAVGESPSAGHSGVDAATSRQPARPHVMSSMSHCRRRAQKSD
jgi:hypothetical protein